MSDIALAAVEIIAHRGYSERAPENTTIAMELGWKHCGIGELDIHLSLDGRMMVIHDASTSRTTDEDYVVSATTSQKLRELDAGIWKGEQFVGTKIPFLEEVLEMLPAGKGLFIEIKSGVETVPVLKKAIDMSGKKSQLTIITFHYDVAEAAKKQNLNVPVYWLVNLKKDRRGVTPKTYSPDIVTSAVKAGLEGLNLQYKGVNQNIVDAARKAGLKFYVWTVDDPQEAVRVYRLGVDGITTNDPLLIRKAIEGADGLKNIEKSPDPENKQTSPSRGGQAKGKKARSRRAD